MQAIIAAVTLVGAITTYSAGTYAGQPLYCGGLYEESENFIALPVSLYESDQVQCGDVVRVTINGVSFWSLAMDAGPFGHLRVDQWNANIVADVPEHLWPGPGISASGSVFNLSAFNREMSDCKMGHMQ